MEGDDPGQKPLHLRIQASLISQLHVLQGLVQRFWSQYGGIYDRGLLALLALEASVVALWCVPYSLKYKVQFVKRLTSSSLFKMSTPVFPWAIIVLGISILVQLIQRYRTDLHRLERSVWALLLLLFTGRAHYLAGNNVDSLVLLEHSALERDMVRWRPPPKSLVDVATSVYRAVLHPVFLHIDRVPETTRPLLFVSNHTIMGFDFPLLLHGLYQRRGMFLRVLADHSHFQIPGNAEVMRNILGAVDGTSRNVDLLMQSGACVFVYPGGARETFKRTTDRKYELMWKDHLGFARAAVKHGCTIIPVTNIGTVVYDLPLSWLPIPFLSGSDRTLPVMKPKLDALQRVYFQFGEPIHTEQYKGRESDMDVLVAVRDATQTAIETGLTELRQYRSADPKRFNSVISTSSAGKYLAQWFRKVPETTKPSLETAKM